MWGPSLLMSWLIMTIDKRPYRCGARVRIRILGFWLWSLSLKSLCFNMGNLVYIWNSELVVDFEIASQFKFPVTELKLTSVFGKYAVLSITLNKVQWICLLQFHNRMKCLVTELIALVRIVSKSCGERISSILAQLAAQSWPGNF